ncbi:hypothetical protein D1BOALGB6SA_1829 [Olavius sp. associated proteobacterium Delta 1]|nr:hypothetical protein D1BOALGB6SA_1829 [Olavius sp. associated proteobacterium Delta 1]
MPLKKIPGCLFRPQGPGPIATQTFSVIIISPGAFVNCSTLEGPQMK